MDLTTIPSDPGCYIYRDSHDNIIYIGKAKSLKKRVSSYFQKTDHDPKTAVLVSHINSVDTIITKNEKEALILENNLIKKHQPKYNIDLKDSRRYAYIMLTKEEFPRLIIARNKSEDGYYFGPFVSAEVRDNILKIANNMFKIRTCRKLPKRVCLRYHMKLCDAPCIGNINKTDYGKLVENSKSLLSGRQELLVKELKENMKQASSNQEYEVAKTTRDQIYAIESLNEKQNMETNKKYDQDVINYMVKESNVYLAIFKVDKGVMSGKAEFNFSYKEEFLEEFLVQYYSEEKIPKEIIIPEHVTEEMENYLSDIKGASVALTIPERGEKKDLMDLVKKNIEKSFFENELALDDLKEKLNLPILPKIIECFDISHLSGTDSVGSMVIFVNGKADKSGYRRFRIKTIEGIDDFAMIAEVVRRRYSRLIEEKKDMPDLIMIDGGKGQLSSACGEIIKLGLKIPTISLAKKNEEVYFPGSEFPKTYDRKSRALQLLQRIRDEAHWFAITYQKLLRKKRVLEQK